MRLVVAAAAFACGFAILGACGSFEEGGAAPSADATTADGDDGNDGDGGVAIEAGDGPATSFCDSYRDSSAFCFDFDTEALEPKWKLSTIGDASIELVQDQVVSAPRAVHLSIDQPSADGGASIAAIGRGVLGDVGSATIDFDISVAKVSRSTSVLFTQLFNAAGVFWCGFGINIDVQAAVTLVSSTPYDGGTLLGTANAVDVLPSSGFVHVTLHWTSAPPQISAKVGSVDLGPMSVPACVASKRAETAFGPQISQSPVSTDVRIDNIVYSFAP